MQPKKLFIFLALAVPPLVARVAGATEPATDMGLVQVVQTPTQPPPTPSQPPPTPTQPPPYPPQQYQQPQPQYQQPQPQYQQPQYQQPQPQPQAPPPRRRPYAEGDPVPEGFHVEETPRKGLVIAGFIVLGIPYGISALTAISAKGSNETNWLFVPLSSTLGS